MTRTGYPSLALLVFTALAGAQTAPNWTQLSPKNSPPGRQNFGMVYDSAHGQAVLFGGADASFNSLGDTWVFDGTNWSQVSQFGGPPARYLYGMAYDAQHSQTVVFGGIGPGDTDLNDTWLWDGSNWSQRTPATNPSTRDSHAMAYDSLHNLVVLFGGYSPDSGDLNDTWLWNGSGWTQSGSATSPQPRDSHALAYDAVHHQVVLFGGVNSSHILLNDTWVWDGASWTQKMPTNGTQTSATYNIMVNSTEPGLLAPAAFKIGGNQYVVALLPDGATYILPTGAIAGVASRPAHPGETIMMYGIGFGAVMPNTPAGQIAAGSTQLAASFQILFGQTSAQITYFGLSPGFVGLYQFDVVVPAVSDNDLVPLTFNLGGAAGTQTLYIAVHQ